MKKQHVVILGGGFGGIYSLLKLVRRLRRGEVKITLVNRTNYFLFTPLLHEVATGGIAKHNVVESLRAIIKPYGVDLVVGEVKNIDPSNKNVEIVIGGESEKGEKKDVASVAAERVTQNAIQNISYDILVIATGATTNFFGTPGAAEHALVLKNLSDASAIRNKVIDSFEKSTLTSDLAERRRLLNFVIIGGGATGVELAAELSDWYFDSFKKFYKNSLNGEEISIHLSTDGDCVLKQFHQKIQARSAKILKDKGVKINFQARAVRVEEKRVIFADNSEIETETIIWVAGVTPEKITADSAFKRDDCHRIVVNNRLQVVDHPNIFALGDAASYTPISSAKNGVCRPLPMLAQVAVVQGKIVGENVFRTVRNLPLKTLKYKRKGDLVSLGSWQALADISGVIWSGPLAWFIWRTIYLTKFLAWSKKIRIAIDWTLDIFYPRDITRA